MPPKPFCALPVLILPALHLLQVVKNMGTTLGACGDVNRNVMAPPTPFKNRPEYEHADK